jgi:hypothetical protein
MLGTIAVPLGAFNCPQQVAGSSCLLIIAVEKPFLSRGRLVAAALTPAASRILASRILASFIK